MKANLARAPWGRRPCLFWDFALHPQPLIVAPQARQLCAFAGRQRPRRTTPGVDLGLLHPAPQRRLSQPQLPRNRADTLAALAYQPYRLGLVLIRKRSPLASAALLHDPLLAHFRASRGVHVIGAIPISTRRNRVGR